MCTMQTVMTHEGNGSEARNTGRYLCCSKEESGQYCNIAQSSVVITEEDQQMETINDTADAKREGSCCHETCGHADEAAHA